MKQAEVLKFMDEGWELRRCSAPGLSWYLKNKNGMTVNVPWRTANALGRKNLIQRARIENWITIFKRTEK